MYFSPLTLTLKYTFSYTPDHSMQHLSALYPKFGNSGRVVVIVNAGFLPKSTTNSTHNSSEVQVQLITDSLAVNWSCWPLCCTSKIIRLKVGKGSVRRAVERVLPGGLYPQGLGRLIASCFGMHKTSRLPGAQLTSYGSFRTTNWIQLDTGINPGRWNQLPLRIMGAEVLSSHRITHTQG